MPGISIDTKPCFLAQTHFRLSHSALQYYFPSLARLLQQGDMGPSYISFILVTLPPDSRVLSCCCFPFKCKSWILWSEIPLLVNISSPPKRSNMCVDKAYNLWAPQRSTNYILCLLLWHLILYMSQTSSGTILHFAWCLWAIKHCLEMVCNFYFNIFPVIYAGFYKQKEPHTFQEADSLKRFPFSSERWNWAPFEQSSLSF